jgi:hypothetical protein
MDDQGVLGSTQGVLGSTQGVLGSTQGVSGSSQGVSGSTQGVSGSTKPKSRTEYLAKYHRKRLDTLKKNPEAYAEKTAKNRRYREKLEFLKKFREQQKKDIALKKEIAQNLNFNPNVFDSDVDSESELGSEWDFEWDPDKDVQLAQAADPTQFNRELYYPQGSQGPQGAQVNSYLESEEALGYNPHSGGKIKSFGLTIKRKRPKLKKRVTIKHNNKKRRKTMKTRKTK